MIDYQGTTLWVAAFENAAVQTEMGKRARDDLLTAYRKLEVRIEPILDKVPDDCKGLTLHNISHVHQLWTVADQICGPDYPLNPLEGFVLGAAFLIHDAGLTAAAYPGGLDAVRKTKFYRDRVGALLRKESGEAPSPQDLDNPPVTAAERALFDTLRAIHAKRAERLLDTSNLHPLTGEPYPLFPDADLFFDCGEVIGLVAASHHWPIHEVDARFQEPRTPPADFTGWPIDAVKLACIIRTADACAIDERRARIMPFLLADPKGVSRDHWAFQAYLNPGARPDEALVFQSKVPFPRKDMSAWWTAYDAIGIADRELRDSDRLLRARAISGRHPALRPFKVRRVEGAGDPERLKDMVRVSGWTPVDTSVRIENPLALIEKLGGWQLYGNDPSAPLRELIQNAADAVRARRTRPNAYARSVRYPGHIDIILEVSESSEDISSLVLTVADNGLGMPPDIMTGALLDFGRSFWSTEEAAKKYPGLVSDPSFQPTGRFGIGFYAIFMIANDVKIMSRPWNAGLNDVKVLHFREGIRGRAELRGHDESEDGPFSQEHSTLVRAVIERINWIGWFAGLSVRRSEREAEEDRATDFWELVERTARQLVFALDVECRLSINAKLPLVLNKPGILDAQVEEFARAYNEILADQDEQPFSSISPEEVPLIDCIVDAQERVHSRGLVDSSGRHGWIHVGGLSVFREADGLIKGIVAHTPGTAARTGGPRVVPKEMLIRWGNEQLRRVAESLLNTESRLAAIANLARISHARG